MTGSGNTPTGEGRGFYAVLGSKRGSGRGGPSGYAEAAFVQLQRRADRERACPRCRGAGWWPWLGAVATALPPARRVRVCDCSAGERFWMFALDHTDKVVDAFGMDDDGFPTDPGGAYGGFGINMPSLLEELALDLADQLEAATAGSAPTTGKASAMTADAAPPGTQPRLGERLRRVDETALGTSQQAALARLLVRAKRERRCADCRGYGWYPRLDPSANAPALQARVCASDAGERYWLLALDHTAAVLVLMDLDADGHIASVDGLYGRFGINDRRLLRLIALAGSDKGAETDALNAAEGER